MQKLQLVHHPSCEAAHRRCESVRAPEFPALCADLAVAWKEHLARDLQDSKETTLLRSQQANPRSTPIGCLDVAFRPEEAQALDSAPRNGPRGSAPPVFRSSSAASALSPGSRARNSRHPLTAKAQGFDGSTPFHQKRGGLNLENRTIKAVEMSIDSIYAMRDETGKGARSHHPRHVNDFLKALPGPSERALLSASLLSLPALTSCTFCSHGDDDNLCHHHDSQLPLKCRGLVLHYC